MRLGYFDSDFSTEALAKAVEALKSIGPGNESNALGRVACRRVPFLATAFDRVDELCDSEAEAAVDLAVVLCDLVQLVPVYPEDSTCFASEAERGEFESLAEAVLVTALAYASRYEEAARLCSELTRRVRTGSKYLRAEVGRRASLVPAHYGDYDVAERQLSEAAALFEEAKRPDMSALAVLRRGTVRRLRDGVGSGVADYSLAIEKVSRATRRRKAIRQRVSRVGLCAAINLSREFYKSSMELDRTLARNLSRAISNLPRKSRIKGSAMMAEGMLSARAGSTRKGLRILKRALGMFIDLNAHSDVAECIVEILYVAAHWHQDSFDDEVAYCQRAIESCDRDGVVWIRRWLHNSPSAESVEDVRNKRPWRGDCNAASP